MALPRISLERDTERLQQLAVKLRNVLLNMKTANIVPGRGLHIVITQKLPRGMLTKFIDRHDDAKADVQMLSAAAASAHVPEGGRPTHAEGESGDHAK